MMQFLKSILSPESTPTKNISDKIQREKTLLLEARVALLEKENEKSAETVKELSSCIQSMSILLADLAADVSVLAASLNSIIKQSQSSYEDDIFKRYLKDDDDDGYLN